MKGRLGYFSLSATVQSESRCGRNSRDSKRKLSLFTKIKIDKIQTFLYLSRLN